MGTSGWFQLLQQTIATSVSATANVLSVRIPQQVDLQYWSTQGAAVVIHESDGFDMTAVVTSLVQLMIDPYFRTVKGFDTDIASPSVTCSFSFECLIEKEWLRFGHPFSSRHSHSGKAGTQASYRAPIFTLFLDCIWQVCHPSCSTGINIIILDR